ncbi:phage terminase, small subunit, putative, P27 family [Halomonas shengliensis]|uniref:Phage terminase, small subunit, putative, P27 family n=1 Tax=Halomonas shengliensis TaxID=419597 RepID=A0A1H0LWE9_9GAMM|nr:phage terminase small subunit P27 family [Halomonas shengliensis]SDO72381.1 phage terminase, small subunit, putative, P27 family [Halomonas shengliensis]
MAGTSKSGRKPKPSHLKAVQGNPGKRAVNHDEPQGDALTEAPPPPAWLDDNGRAAWLHHVEWLVRTKILTRSDLHLFETYCDAYATWRAAVEDVARNGLTVETAMGGISKNPALTAKNEAFRQMTVAGSALGLTPADRARLAVPGAKDADNPFKELLGGKQR